MHENVLRKWQRQLEVQGEQAFRGKGQQTAIEEENRRLRQEVRRLTMERDIFRLQHGICLFRKIDGLLCQGVEMKYSFIEDHREQWPVSMQCGVLQVTRSGFYAWRSREQSGAS